MLHAPCKPRVASIQVDFAFTGECYLLNQWDTELCDTRAGCSLTRHKAAERGSAVRQLPAPFDSLVLPANLLEPRLLTLLRREKDARLLAHQRGISGPPCHGQQECSQPH